MVGTEWDREESWVLRKASRSGKIVHASGIEPAMLSRGPKL